MEFHVSLLATRRSEVWGNNTTSYEYMTSSWPWRILPISFPKHKRLFSRLLFNFVSFLGLFSQVYDAWLYFSFPFYDYDRTTLHKWIEAFSLFFSCHDIPPTMILPDFNGLIASRLSVLLLSRIQKKIKRANLFSESSIEGVTAYSGCFCFCRHPHLFPSPQLYTTSNKEESWRRKVKPFVCVYLFMYFSFVCVLLFQDYFFLFFL